MAKSLLEQVAARPAERPSPHDQSAPTRDHIAPAPEPHFAYNPLKRTTDIVGALVLAILISPLLVVVAILIRLSCGSPIFFVQRRYGLGGQEFGCWKFRTMIDGAEARRDEVLALNMTDGPTLKLKHDPRVTRLGTWLRKTSIDELPQLWNVLTGDMSLVGPRPLPLIENKYEGEQMRRLSVQPGITCIWQVSGRSKVTFGEWMEMDLEYVQSRTWFKDIWLLLRTIPAVLSARGAV